MAVLKDCLNRTEDKKRVLNIIRAASNRQERLSFAINGRWGSGKSFFVNMLQQDLQADYFVFKYDSWDNDYYDDPLIGMLDSIKDQLNGMNPIEKGFQEAEKRIVEKVVNVIGAFIDEVVYSRIGVKPIKAIKKIKSFWDECSQESKISDDFNPYNKIKAAKQLIIASINKLSEIRPIIFIVDEIDRCFPTYTLKIIERIHHISENVNRCITIFSVDMNQLQRIIELTYNKDETGSGEKDVVKGYLRKVVDFTYDLGPGTLNNYFFDALEGYEKKFGAPAQGIEESEIGELLFHLFDGIELRTTHKIIKNAKYAHDLVFGDEVLGLDALCAELLFAWAIKEYGHDFLSKLKEDLFREDVERKPFPKYLTDEQSFEFFTRTDEELQGKWFDVYNLKTLMLWLIMSNFDMHTVRMTGGFGNITKIPEYFEKMADSYLPCIIKITC